MQMLPTPSLAQSAPPQQAPDQSYHTPVGQEKGASAFQQLLNRHQLKDDPTGQSQGIFSLFQCQEALGCPNQESAVLDPAQQELAAAVIAQGMVILPTEALVSSPAIQVPVVTGADPLVQTLGRQIVLQQPVLTENRIPFQLPAQGTDGTAPQPAVGNLIQDGLRQQSPSILSPAQPLGQTPELIKGTPSQLTGQTQQELDAEVITVTESNERPLFRQLEHTPLKVGEAPTANVNSPNFERALAKPIQQALGEGAQTLEIKLTPAHLGTVTVSLTQNQDGTLHVLLQTMTDKATRLLSEHTGGLTHLLQTGRHPGVQIEVQQSEQGQQQGQEDRQGQGQRDPREQQERRQQQQQERQHTSDNFLQQLRLGLLPLTSEAV